MMQLECITCAPLHAGPNPTRPVDPTNPNDATEELGEGQFITKVSFTAQSLVDRAIGVGHCVFCRLIFSSLCEVLGRGKEPEQIHDPIVVERHDVGPETGPMVVKFGPASARREVQIYSMLKAGKDDIHEVGSKPPWDSIGQGFDVPLEALDDNCTHLARAWLDSCTDPEGDHTNCTPPEANPELPSRVIDVDIGSLCLINTVDPETGERQRAKYAALSYYWGKEFPAPTTKANRDFRTITQLPTIANLFSDAYDFTRAMGIRYIWTDAMCLTVDDEEERDREISRMGEIYEKAEFTISADASHNPQGFLRSPNRDIRQRFVVDYLWATEDRFHHGAVWVRERGRQSPTLCLHDFPPWGADTMDPEICKLQTRAWAFQERVLPARTFHFGKTEFGYECRSSTTCQCSAFNVRPRCQTSIVKRRMTELLSSDKDEAERCWREEVVPDFTRRDIFRPIERLLALSGLAWKFSQLREGETYHVGLWESSMAIDLLWHGSYERPSVRQASYIAPSWSWGSITGAISYSWWDDVNKISPTFQVKEIDVKPAGAVNKLGNVKPGARLRIQGVCLKAFYQSRIEDIPNDKGAGVEFGEDTAPGLGVVGHDISMEGTGRDFAFLPVWDVHEFPKDKSQELLVLLVSEAEEGPFGLVLQKSTPIQENGQSTASAIPAYERVGFVGRRQTGTPNRFGTFESELKTSPPWLEDEEIEQKQKAAAQAWRYWESLGTVMEIDLV